ncbi:helicase-primase helicase subunit [Common bottlenose dolphin gammaherpesvirus 1 strain Sarasota]|uniref:Helicase-primase helicase subunit n=1 Tax=Common bottlenose dolphin gammaherpesvirus 1 strain Sarasota TaxID=2022783 RepID=A0A1Z1NE30_9GAMA|nr:helicase-primase helicase subunit [Common bottlenose dolphin gammaherpesvirus 1 strain Sarasota]ARW78106.1 helicase-primase helicase subunit [Common bottlenose dolphin gammaherpesvirus 1 strain Sarasota]
MEAVGDAFVLNMTSDSKVRKIVDEVDRLSRRRTRAPPEMDWFDSQFDPEDCDGPLLPFSAYVITGTAGAGKSTSIAALYQSLNCLVTGATMVAAQNLSRGLKAFCPTIYNAFGFKSRHVNVLNRQSARVFGPNSSMTQIQHRDLSKYWPVISDISQEFTKKRQRGLYGHLSPEAFNMLTLLNSAQLWTTNIIVIDEAGTLSSHILTTVVYFYWLYNSWLNTPLYKEGAVPCVVCVGSPTQTDAYQSMYNHEKQKNQILECDNILSFLLGNPVVANYVNITHHWALFINNKRCTDPEFGHLLKTLEYGLDVSEEVMSYIDRLVVPASKILDPLEYIGWTRLFLSHQEVKTYLVALHTALAAHTNSELTKLFTCPIVCEVFLNTFEEYKTLVNLPNLTPFEWLTKNLPRLSNYSQFVDQDMNAISTELTRTSMKVTYVVQYVKNSYISLNSKTKKCVCGFMGTYGEFKAILDNDTFVDHHAQDQPEFVYSFLSTLLYNSMYNFHQQGATGDHEEFLRSLDALVIPPHLMTGPESERVGFPVDHWPSANKNVDGGPGSCASDLDGFYHTVPPPPSANSTSLPTIICIYSALKKYFLRRLEAAVSYFGEEFYGRNFSTFTFNVLVRNGVDFTSNSPKIQGLLDYASNVESYRLKGYTFVPVYFGRPPKQELLSRDLQNKMPNIVVQDSTGFVACLENNVNKMTETLEGGKLLHLCSAGDYGVSSNLAMTIAKAQGLSLNKVAVSFGHHKAIKKSHVYVAISRATDPKSLVLDCNPLSTMSKEKESICSTRQILQALNNPETLLVY